MTMNDQNWLYPEMGNGNGEKTVEVIDVQPAPFSPLPGRHAIRPRSVIGKIPSVIFYPVVLYGAASLLMSPNAKTWGTRFIWLGIGTALGAAYVGASLDVERVFRGELTWDQWEASHPFLKHFWAFLGRFAA